MNLLRYFIGFLLGGLLPMILTAQSGIEKQIDSLSFAAVLEMRQGKNQAAIPLAQAALDKARTLDDVNSKRTHTAIMLLAKLYGSLGQFEEALHLHQELESLLLALSPPDSIFLGQHYDNMGTLYFQDGRYREAEACFYRARELWEAQPNIRQDMLATNHNNLGMLNQVYGVWDRAIQHFQTCYDILLPMLGNKHPFILQTLSNLGTVHYYGGILDSAASYYRQARELAMESLPPQHPVQALLANNLAGVYQRQDRLDEAENMARDVIRIQEVAMGEGDPVVSMSWVNLAKILERKGDYEGAIAAADTCRVRMLRTVGSEFPAYSSVLIYLSTLYREKGDLESSRALLLQGNELERSQLLHAAKYMTETEMIAFQKSFLEGQSALLQLLHLKDDPELAKAGYDNQLVYKGQVLTATRRWRERVSRDPQAQQSFADWQAVEKELANRYRHDPDGQIILDSLEDLALRLEKSLIVEQDISTDEHAPATWSDIRDRLDPGELAIEFVDYRLPIPDEQDKMMYGAFLIGPGMSSPKFIKLCPEAPIRQILNPGGQITQDHVDRIYGSSNRGLSPNETNAPSLYELIWSPLEQHLPKTGRIYYSASGLLHRINLEAIAYDLDSVMSDCYSFHLLISTRDLKRTDRSRTLLPTWLYGGIEFGNPSDTASIKANDKQRRMSSGPQVWGDLPWTKREVRDIAGILTAEGIPVQVRTGTAATEESLDSLEAITDKPRVLHFATHGFFETTVNTMSSRVPSMASIGPEAKVLDPMVRSGLILSGGNKGWTQTSLPSTDAEDGILTAAEVCQMNLEGIDLVVLSACESGLGEIIGHEGVFGLQRAFRIAGADILIFSLWPVSDRATNEFMVSFYRIWAKEKLTPAEAFVKAQKAMRDRFLAPYYWAGLVMLE